MNLRWSARAQADVLRLHDFLAPMNPRAADEVVILLRGAADRLRELPRIGERVDRYEPREVRRLIVARRYEMHYEIRGDEISIVRIWHVREDR